MRFTPRKRQGRAGFTLVELLVAIALIDVGILALVAGSAVVLRTRNGLRARALAARIASDRVQSLAALACTPSVGEADGPSGMRERWSVVLVPDRVREVRDSVAFESGGVARAVVLATRLPC